MYYVTLSLNHWFYKNAFIYEFIFYYTNKMYPMKINTYHFKIEKSKNFTMQFIPKLTYTYLYTKVSLLVNFYPKD